MNKKLIGLVLALSIPLTVVAGPWTEGGPDAHHGKRIEHLTKELGLNDDQKAKVEAIFKEQKEKFKAIHEETQTRLKAVLTPEQAKKLDELHARRPKRGDAPPAPGKPE